MTQWQNLDTGDARRIADTSGSLGITVRELDLTNGTNPDENISWKVPTALYLRNAAGPDAGTIQISADVASNNKTMLYPIWLSPGSALNIPHTNVTIRFPPQPGKKAYLESSVEVELNDQVDTNILLGDTLDVNNVSNAARQTWADNNLLPAHAEVNEWAMNSPQKMNDIWNKQMQYNARNRIVQEANSLFAGSTTLQDTGAQGFRRYFFTSVTHNIFPAGHADDKAIISKANVDVLAVGAVDDVFFPVDISITPVGRGNIKKQRIFSENTINSGVNGLDSFETNLFITSEFRPLIIFPTNNQYPGVYQYQVELGVHYPYGQETSIRIDFEVNFQSSELNVII